MSNLTSQITSYDLNEAKTASLQMLSWHLTRGVRIDLTPVLEYRNIFQSIHGADVHLPEWCHDLLEHHNQL